MNDQARLIRRYLDPWLEGKLASEGELVDETVEQPGAGESSAAGDVDPFRRVQRLLACARQLDALWGAAQSEAPHPQPATEAAEGSASPEHKQVFASDQLQQLGRFEIRGELGRGGGGVVLRAYDPRLRREVALKLPHPGALFSASLRERFMREAQVAALLDHPYILPVFEAGEVGTVCYIAAFVCDGPTLAQWLRERQPPVSCELAARLIGALAGAMQHAHDHGVLHRDLKPSNVLLTTAPAGADNEGLAHAGLVKDGRPLTPKLADFGMAGLVNETSDLTMSGAPLGTLHYMAPEQAAGRRQDVSVASDVYGLGAIFYELLSGQAPLVGASAAETLELIRSVDPPSPSRRRSGIPRDLDAVCLKCLEKDPLRRYTSAAALRDDVQRWLRGQPVQARQISAVERLWRAARRAPLVAALVLAASVLLLTVLVGQAIYSRQLANSLATSRQQTELAQSRLGEIERQKGLVDVARSRAEAGEQRTRSLLYASDMRNALEAWRNHELPEVQQRLASHVPSPERPQEQREFLWKLLDASCHVQPLLTCPHGAPVTACVTTPDGAQLITAAEDGKVRIWRAEDGELLHGFTAHLRAARALAISPDGELLATGGDDQLVHVWRVKDRSYQRLFGLMRTGIESLAWSPDGQWLAAGARYSEVRVWQVQGDRSLKWENDHRHEALAFSADSRRLFVPTRTALAAWQLDEPAPQVFHATGSLDNVRELLLIDAGRRVLAAERFGHLSAVFDSETGAIVDYLDVQASYPQQLAAAPGGAMAATVAADGVLRLVSLRKTPGARHDLAGICQAHEGVANAVCFLDEERVATAGADGMLKVWRVSELSGHRVHDPGPHIRYAGWDATGRLLAVQALSEARPMLFDVAQGKMLGRTFDQGGFVAGEPSAMSADGRWLAIAGVKGELAVWDVLSGKIAANLPPAKQRIEGLCFGDEGRVLVAVNAAVGVTLWRAELDWLGGPSRPWREYAELTANHPVAGPDGRFLALSLPGQGQVQLWDLRQGETERTIVAEKPSHLAFSPVGDLLAGVCGDNYIVIWNVEDGKVVAQTHQYSSNLYSLAFGPEGTTLFTGHNDGSLRAWHLPTRQSLGVVFQPPRGDSIIRWLLPDSQRPRMAALLFSPTPKLLVFGR